jgi:hypothetical protein
MWNVNFTYIFYITIGNISYFLSLQLFFKGYFTSNLFISQSKKAKDVDDTKLYGHPTFHVIRSDDCYTP